jgi:CubicO group peptidase (beta-lactamase class C family)
MSTIDTPAPIATVSSRPMAKTITAMLIGIAISENKIKSTDDTVSAYVPSLANTEYGKTSIRTCCICRQASRLRNYDGSDDVAKLGQISSVSQERIPLPALPNLTPYRSAGTKWHYASSETKSWGLCCGRQSVSPFRVLHERIWQAIGTEADASWAIDGTGQSRSLLL